MKPKLNAVFKKYYFVEFESSAIVYTITAESEAAARMLLPVWMRERAELLEVTATDECHAGAVVSRIGMMGNGERSDV